MVANWGMPMSIFASAAASLFALRRTGNLFRGRAIDRKRAGTAGLVVAALLALSAQPALGQSSPFDLFIKSYVDEWGKPPPAPDPKAPPTRWPETMLPPQPQTIPPYPFTEWPFGGASAIGATVPNSQGGALMKALAPTDFGKWLKSNNIEIYGWINGGGNLSNAAGPNFKNANFPAAYMYSANTFTMDQAVVYVERLPDTVQRAHIDWGFRVAGLYGENYRYTQSLGIGEPYQFQKNNNAYGWDLPMVYGELYIPWVAQGMLIRAGRFISVPDIEAQLAPNNYMYSHSMTYGYDNYTNTGINAAIQLNKNWMVQIGILDGTEVALWVPRKDDPGKQATLEACVRYVSNSAYDSFYVCADGINNGTFGYNNLQWYGLTYYHKFDEKWHVSAEYWNIHINNVPNTDVGTPTLPQFANMINGPFLAHCGTPGPANCTAKMQAALAYLNYKWGPMDNISWRVELFDDENGQRTGFKTRYFNYAIGWQHWFSPSVTFRPEIAGYNSLDTPAFNNGPGNNNLQSRLTVFSADIIWHF
jgi:putative OmpL-like beta-barrel porin-2